MFGKEDGEEELVFDDGTNYQYGNQGNLTHEQLVLQQIKRVMEEGSKEMVGGYFKEQMTAKGMKEVYIPDQKQVYIRSIMSLYDVMIFKYGKNETFKNAKEKFDTSLKEIKDKALNLIQAKLDYMNKQEQTKGIQYPDSLKQSLEIQLATGMIDSDSYEAKIISDQTLDAYRYLFQALVLVYGDTGFGSEQELSGSEWLQKLKEKKAEENK